jgi:thioredoxin
MSVIELADDSAFMDKLSEAGQRLVVVDFFATWCGPCNAIAPFLKQLATKNPNVMFLKVDVDKCPGTAAANNVSAMPTFVFFRNRGELERLRGADKNALESKVKLHAEGGSSSQPGEGSDEKPAGNSEYVSH